MQTSSVPQFFAARVFRAGLFAAALAFAGTVCGQSNCNRARFFPAPGAADSMVGGRFTGSNESATTGFQELAQISALPTEGAWNTLDFTNNQVYRWIKYEGPTGSGGIVAELEFYSTGTAGTFLLSGTTIAAALNQPGWFGTTGSTGADNANDYLKAGDRSTATYFESSVPDYQYAGYDLGSSVQVAQPYFSPTAGVFASATTVRITCSTAGSSMRYTTDGSTPTRGYGVLVAGTTTVPVSAKTSIVAIAFKDGMADSVLQIGTYIIGGTAGNGHKTWHGGNSLTDTINGWLEPYAESAGYDHTFLRFTIPGAPTDWNWTHPVGGFGGEPTTGFFGTFDVHSGTAAIAHMSTQPFAGHGRDLDNESFYSNLFFQRARHKFDVYGVVSGSGTPTVTTTYSMDRDGGNNVIPLSPNVHPWSYVQWTNTAMSDSWATATGSLAGFGLWPGATYEECIANQVFYHERLRERIEQRNLATSSTYSTTGSGTTRIYIAENVPGMAAVKIIPAGVALARVKHLADTGQIPGMTGTEFFARHYADGVHMNPAGRYLVALTFFASFYKVSPEGLVISAGSGLTPAQAAIYQRAAWDVVQNYAWGDVYTTGTTPCGAPTFSPSAGPIGQSTPVTFNATTAGAWFRYTTDGSDPTPAAGQLYIAPLTVRPGMAFKAVAFKGGMAPSAVVSASYAAVAGTELILEEPFAMAAGTLRKTAPYNAALGDSWTTSGTNLSFTTTGTTTLSFGALKTSGGMLLGGTNSIGRQFKLNAETPWVSYLKDGVANPRGRSLWFSAVLQKSATNDNAVAVHFTSNSGGLSYSTNSAVFAIGYFGSSSNSGNVRYWGIRINGTTYRSNVAVVPNQPALLVANFIAGSPHQAVVYVNPAHLGGALPAMTGTGGTTTSQNMASLCIQMDAAGAGAADEIRVGENYAAVTPAPPETPGAPAVSATTGQVALAWSPAYAAAAYLVKRGTAAGGPFAVVGTAVSGTAYTDTTVANGTAYYYVVSGTNGAGEGSASGVSAAASPQTGYNYWRDANFTAAEIAAGQADMGASPAGDGVTNLTKFALGIANPKQPATSGLPTATRPDASTLRFTFRRERSDVTYVVETSSTPGAGWGSFATNPGVAGSTVTVDIPVAPGATNKFVRLHLLY